MKTDLRALTLGLCTSLLSACGPAQAFTELPVAVVKKEKFVRIVEADGYLRPVRTTPVTLSSLVMGSIRIAWLAADGSIVKKGDPLVRFDDEELKLRLKDAEAQGAIAEAEKERERVNQRTEVKDRQREIRAAERELTFQRAFAPRDSEIFSRDKIIEGQATEHLQESKVAIAHSSEQLGRGLDRSRRGLTEVKASRAQEDIRRARDGLRSLDLSAAHDGVFTLERDADGVANRVGDTVWRGEVLGKVSKVEQMEAEVFVLESEATGLLEGCRAQVYIEAQPGRAFAAQIKRVAKVAKTTQSGSPTQYFGVTLALLRTFPDVMKPEQRVRARLQLYEQEALVLPRPALFESDGRWVSYRRDPRGGYRAVPVKLGQSTAGLMTIDSGLQEGDIVALRDPQKPSSR